MTFGAVFPRVLRPAFGPGLAAASAAATWWTAGGATGAVAVYQPKGAASLAASYVNLANPGTYDAAPGTAPTFAAATGWTFAAASTQYLTTGVVPAVDQSWSLLIRYSGNTVLSQSIAQVIQTGANRRFGLSGYYGGDQVVYYNGGQLSVAPKLAAGVLGIAGATGYRNGTADAGTIATATGTLTTDLYLGARHLNAGVDEYFTGSIQAVAIYSTILTAPQVAAISTAMAAL